MSQAPAEPPLITTAAGLDDLVAHLRAAGRFAFDTEFVSEETFEPILCLIQVATADRLARRRPPSRPRPRGRSGTSCIDPSIEVVMHAAGEDLRICKIQTGTVPARVFDVQIAAGLVGPGYPLSLGNLVQPAAGRLARRAARPGPTGGVARSARRSSATRSTTSATSWSSPTASPPS